MDFDVFVRDMTTGLHASSNGGRGARRPKEPQVKQAVLAELTALHPWLDPEDIAPAKDKAKSMRRRAAGGQPTPGADLEEPHAAHADSGSDADEDFDIGDVDAQLAAVRADLVPDDADPDEFFSFRILGGRWTHQHIGVAADAAMAAARGGLATAWAAAHHFPKSKRFNFRKYGRENARVLALEVWRRGIFLQSVLPIRRRLCGVPSHS